ncbi:MAG TPA: nuclear transport factor 2 family protein [Thermoanaerobaculia bacterium]|nr:nuclear transport factor 2 family protein [Thermoanaerobaculia bacterium]
MVPSLLLVAIVAAAEQPTKPTEAQTRDQLIALDKKVAAAVSAHDVPTLERILATDYSFTDGSGKKASRSEWLAHVKGSGGKALGAEITTSEYEVKIYGSVALMSHLTRSQGSGGSAEQLKSFHVWQRRGNRWQLVSHQWMPVEAPRPGGVAECARYSFEPEVRQYYGDSAAIIRKLDRDDMGLQNRTGYIAIVETDGSAELTMFERPSFKEESVRVSQWSGASATELREQLSNLLLANRGIACIGQQSKALVKAKLRTTDLGAIPLPVSARAAFAHLVKKNGARYMRATFLLLC